MHDRKSVLGGATPASQAFAAEPPACRAIEIKFDLIRQQITSVETNQLLFASADMAAKMGRAGVAFVMALPRHPPGPPMDLTNTRGKALPRSAVPVILFILSIIVVGVAFYLARWLTAPV